MAKIPSEVSTHAARLLRQYRKDITPAEVLDAAWELLIEKRDPVRKTARAKMRLEKKNRKQPVENIIDTVTPAPGQQRPASQPEKASRYIPAAVRHAVYSQERGRRAYVSPTGKRCPGAVGLHRSHLSIEGPVSLGVVEYEHRYLLVAPFPLRRLKTDRSCQDKLSSRCGPWVRETVLLSRRLEQRHRRDRWVPQAA